MRVFVASRLHPNDKYSVEENIEFARACCKHVVDRQNWPYSPVVLCTQFLDENDPKQRETGMRIGLEFLNVCDALWVYRREHDDEITTGMRLEIDHATTLGIPVSYWTIEQDDQKAGLVKCACCGKLMRGKNLPGLVCSECSFIHMNMSGIHKFPG